jgi:uncharacterized protein YbjT (DUF2867 family)
MGKKIAVLGGTGQIGRELTQHLLGRGHEVRAIGRDAAKLSALQAQGAETHSADFLDATALTEAFRGADAVFAMVAPHYGADDFGAYQDKAGEAIARAVEKAGVKRLVNLSSIGASEPDGTGPIKGLHRQEKRLNALAGLSVVHLRPGYFMQNLFWAIHPIKSAGVLPDSIKGDLPLWMVSTSDIARKAADFFDKEFQGQTVFEFGGPKPYTMNEAAAALGKAIGKPDLKYVQISYDDHANAMKGAGMKPSISGLMVEMTRGMNEGKVRATQDMTDEHRGKTTLDSFAAVFAQAYKS